MTQAATAPPPSSSPANDFADWLSPILVKELRQGLKTKVFVGIFILLQLVMLFVFALRLVDENDRGFGEGFNAFFWLLLYLPLLLIMPGRGLGTVSEEVKANTLDLVQLTRLGAFRIVWGKWLALVTQSLLLVVAILPYALLRYFFGSVNVADDLVIMGILLGVSAVLTAGAIAASTLPAGLRVILIVLAVMMFFSGSNFFFLSRALGGPRGSIFGGFAGPNYWFWIGLFAAYILFFLLVAASRIAPASANFSLGKRALALLLSLIPLLIWFVTKEEEYAVVFFASCLPIISWIVVDALCEKTSELPSNYALLARKGIPGRLAGLFLYPGWATGVLFTFVIWLVGLQVFRLTDRTLGRELGSLIPGVLLLAGVLLPVIPMVAWKRFRQKMPLYLLVQVLFLLVFIFLSTIARSHDDSDSMLLASALFPATAFYALMARDFSSSFQVDLFPLAPASAILVLIIVLCLAMRELKRLRQWEKQAIVSGERPQNQSTEATTFPG